MTSRANRASSHVACEFQATPLPFHDDSSKTPTDWIGIVILLWTKRKVKRYLGTFSSLYSSRFLWTASQSALCTDWCLLWTICHEKKKTNKQTNNLWLAANRSFSYSRYWTGTSLQLRLMRGVFSNANDIYLFNYIFRTNLHCKLVPVQYE